MFQGRILTHEVQSMCLCTSSSKYTSAPITEVINNSQRNKPRVLIATTIPNDFRQLLHVALSDGHAVCLFG